MKKDIIILSTTIAGSKLYHTSLDTSDNDFITVFMYKPELALAGDRPSIFREGETVYYELSKFIQLLISGELTCHEVLWTDGAYWKEYKGEFAILREIRRRFISKSVLKNWLYTSSYLFGRAKRIGDLYLDDKSVINFLTAITYSATRGTKAEPFQTTINRGAFDLSSMHYNTPLKLDQFGAITLSKKADLYAVWQDYKGTQNEQSVSGIIRNDALILDDDLIEEVSNITSRYSFRGMLYYDRRRHEAYKRLQKELKDAKIIKGYAPKSMYHSFRILFSLYTFLTTGNVPTESANISFLLDIRRGHYTFDYLNQRYQAEYKIIAEKLEAYETPEDVDYSSLVSFVTKLKRNIEDKSSIVPTASLV